VRVFKKTANAKRFTIELKDHQGVLRRFAGLTDRRQSEQLARRIRTLIECRAAKGSPDMETSRWLENAPPALKLRLAAVGIIDGERISAARPLAELVKDFIGHLEAKERTAAYVNGCQSMLSRMFENCRFVVWSDIGPGKVEGYLKRLRSDGLSVRRSNGYLTAAKGFCRWMVDTRQASESPLRGLRKLNERIDVRRQRRAATPEELRKLIATTVTSGELYGMDGQERSLLYRFCAETGLRANETRSLKVRDFDFERLVVVVPAGYSKHRETDTVPIRKDLAEALKQHLSDRLPTSKAFGGRYQRLTDHTAKMFKRDLEAAGVAYLDDRGQVLDFHGLRHTFVTNLSHAPTRVAQRLARHKSSAMTDRYTHVRLNDERAALSLLPDLTGEPNSERAKATCTDNTVVTGQQPARARQIQVSESGARFGALRGTNRQNSAQLGAKQNRVDGGKNAVSKWAGADLNRRHTDFQSVALPTELPAQARLSD
jgi:integrase